MMHKISGYLLALITASLCFFPCSFLAYNKQQIDDFLPVALKRFSKF